MGLFDSLPKGSQVKLWGCTMATKKVGDKVPDFGLKEYIVLLREGGYVSVKNGKIAHIMEDTALHFKPSDFPAPCFSKWGQRVTDKDLEQTGLLGTEDYYFSRYTKSGVGK